MSNFNCDFKPHLGCALCKTHHKSMFGALTDREQEIVDAAKTTITYKKKQVLFHEGTRPLGVFCISSGRVKVYRIGLDGKEQIIKISGAGDLLGYKALISDQHYLLSGEALEDSVVCFIPKEDFLELLKPGSQFYMNLLKAVCEEHGMIASKITEMAQLSVRQRLALSLLMLNDTYGLEQEEGGEIQINLSREDLANIVGTATESLIRLLNEFKKDGLIETYGRKIEVKDQNGLLMASRR